MRVYVGFRAALLLAGVMVSSATGSFGKDKIPVKAEPTEYKAIVEGLVRDVACPIQNYESTATDFNLECAIACAKSDPR